MSFVKARGGGFGMDAELAKKLSLKFDAGRAAAAIKWLADLTSLSPFVSFYVETGFLFFIDVDPFPVEEMGARLKDGRTLCAAANRLQATRNNCIFCVLAPV